MEFGGRKLIASKLDMEYQTQTNRELFRGMSFGPFSLDFGIRLMHFIRCDLMDQSLQFDKLDRTVDSKWITTHQDCEFAIYMPTRQTLLDRGEITLAQQVEEYGGHENIARRLSLKFDETEATKDAIKQRHTRSNGEGEGGNKGTPRYEEIANKS